MVIPNSDVSSFGEVSDGLPGLHGLLGFYGLPGFLGLHGLPSLSGLPSLHGLLGLHGLPSLHGLPGLHCRCFGCQITSSLTTSLLLQIWLASIRLSDLRYFHHEKTENFTWNQCEILYLSSVASRKLLVLYIVIVCRINHMHFVRVLSTVDIFVTGD